MTRLLALRWLLLPPDGVGRYIAALLFVEAALIVISTLGLLSRGSR